jgi:hypothetical protein
VSGLCLSVAVILIFVLCAHEQCQATSTANTKLLDFVEAAAIGNAFNGNSLII